jgi:RNA polymerase sigma-70 factor (ECF subfamily)
MSADGRVQPGRFLVRRPASALVAAQVKGQPRAQVGDRLAPPLAAAQDTLAPLLTRIAQGDRAALRALYEATAPKLFGVCLRILSDREESEDVLQDVYVTIWRRADRFDPKRASVAAWISTIARNRAIDRLRARGPMARAEPVEELEVADERPGAESLLAAAEEAARLHACLGELDERTRAAIRTAFFEGVTYEALARRMDAPLGTVKSWIRRGLARLKGCLER